MLAKNEYFMKHETFAICESRLCNVIKYSVCADKNSILNVWVGTKCPSKNSMEWKIYL